MKNILKKIFLYFSLILFSLLLFIFFINYYVLSFSKVWLNYFENIYNIPKLETWLVFWSSVKWWKPSLILKDRLDVAFEAYKSKKINKIIVSWDNSKLSYNEPKIMKKYLLSLWVKKEDIYEDFAWFDTYDSLYRARDIFKTKEIILFTQDFHLKRAIYISEKLGIKTYWVQTNLRFYKNLNYNNFREVFARIKAFLETDILKVKPKFLWEQIKIVSDDEIIDTKETLKQDIFWETNTWFIQENFE